MYRLIWVSSEKPTLIYLICSSISASILHQFSSLCSVKNRSQTVQSVLVTVSCHARSSAPKYRGLSGVNDFLFVAMKLPNADFRPHSKSKPFPMISSWCHEEFVSLLVLACFVSVSSEGLIKFHLLPYENWRRTREELQHCSRMCGSNAKRSKSNRCALANTSPHRAEVKRGIQSFRSLKVKSLCT